MRRLKLLSVIFISCISASIVAGQSEPPSLSDKLAAVTARGRMLAEYDFAAWHSTDALQATKPPEGLFNGYVARKTDKGWIVAYGKLSENRDHYLIAYELAQGSAPDQFEVKKMDPPREDSGFFWKAALAMDVARKDFHGEKRPYNVSVIPIDTRQFYVYVLPAQTVDKVYAFGGDVRYLISADGLQIVAKTQFHKAILEFDYRKAKPNQLAGGMHTDIFSDIPVDTDVFLVLSRKPTVPEFVGAGGKVFQINVDGTIIPPKK
jgi:hypothetical protein